MPTLKLACEYWYWAKVVGLSSLAKIGDATKNSVSRVKEGHSSWFRAARDLLGVNAGCDNTILKQHLYICCTCYNDQGVHLAMSWNILIRPLLSIRHGMLGMNECYISWPHSPGLPPLKDQHRYCSCCTLVSFRKYSWVLTSDAMYDPHHTSMYTGEHQPIISDRLTPTYLYHCYGTQRYLSADVDRTYDHCMTFCRYA